jgi:transposase
MVMSSPLVITLSDSDRAELTARAQAAKISYRDVLRAKIILACAAGISHAAIAAVLGICDDTVRKWRRRFASQGLAGLKDLPRPGRAATFTPVQKAEITALACTPPEDSKLPLARWSHAELAAAAIAEGLVTSISPATMVAGWPPTRSSPGSTGPGSSPATPDFATKAGRVLDLYARCWQGEPLGEDDYVISADELCEAGNPLKL